MKATFAAGCFWGVESTFSKVKGVISTKVGYTGGETKNPTYKQVCTGKTGHAEAVQIEFDLEKISYEELLEVFWRCHNPTTLNRQGFDFGTQYRSAIFYHSKEQKETAEKSKEQQQNKLRKEIITEIVKADTFYDAEGYHQRYNEKATKC